MNNYLQSYLYGNVFCFTQVTYQRKPIFKHKENIQILYSAVTKIKTAQPFEIDALVILPDHLHCIWRLPENDQDYSSRWREIKKMVSRSINPNINYLRERPIWQRRSRDFAIATEHDWRKYLDYIHYNPVKHGYAKKPSDWPWSSFHTAVKKGWYKPGWGTTEPEAIDNQEFE